jgi:hypothetical protein
MSYLGVGSVYFLFGATIALCCKSQHLSTMTMCHIHTGPVPWVSHNFTILWYTCMCVLNECKLTHDRDEIF